MANGGKFGHGFAAGAAGKAFGFGLQSAGLSLYNQGATPGSFANVEFHHIAARTAIAAAIGGTVSEIGGGTFANGARTAAMQHLFNFEGQGGKGIKKRQFHGKETAPITEDQLEGLSTALTVGAATPCSAVCAVLAAFIDIPRATYHLFVEGDPIKYLEILGPGWVGKSAGKGYSSVTFDTATEQGGRILSSGTEITIDMHVEHYSDDPKP